MSKVHYKALSPEYFEQVIKLANQVHGDGYLCEDSIKDWFALSIHDDINASYVATITEHNHDKLIAFRITFAAQHWQVDQWCSPTLWQVPKASCSYFKCNTVDEDYRGLGIGKKLLQLSSVAAQKQGALAGVAHLWKQSPNNSAIAYFSKCGGQLVKYHADKWHEESKQGYNCILCGYDCHCEAAEMIIYF